MISGSASSLFDPHFLAPYPSEKIEPSRAEYSGYFEGPRWAGFKTFAQETAENCGVSLNITFVDKGFLREYVEYEVCGSPRNVDTFRNEIKAALEQYNKKTRI